MPSNYNVRVSVTDPDLLMAGDSPFANFDVAKIQLYRWTTEALARAGDAGAGSLVTTFTLVAESQTITEAAGPYTFQYYDSGQGSGSRYRYRFADTGLAQFSQFSQPWQSDNREQPTLRQILFDIISLLGETGESGTATAGSTTTATSLPVFSSTLKDDNLYKGHWFLVTQDAGGLGAAPEGEEALIASNVASTGVVTLDHALTAAIANGDSFITSALIRPSEMIRCINRAREGMKVLLSTDVGVFNTDNVFAAPAGVRLITDIFEVLGVSDLGTETNVKDLEPLHYEAYEDGPQVFIKVNSDAYAFPVVRVRYEVSYRDYEGLMSLMSDTTSAPREWLRAAAAAECMEILVRDDAEQGTFATIQAKVERALQTATSRYASRAPARKIKPSGNRLVGPRTY